MVQFFGKFLVCWGMMMLRALYIYHHMPSTWPSDPAEKNRCPALAWPGQAGSRDAKHPGPVQPEPERQTFGHHSRHSLAYSEFISIHFLSGCKNYLVTGMTYLICACMCRICYKMLINVDISDRFLMVFAVWSALLQVMLPWNPSQKRCIDAEDDHLSLVYVFAKVLTKQRPARDSTIQGVKQRDCWPPRFNAAGRLLCLWYFWYYSLWSLRIFTQVYFLLLTLSSVFMLVTSCLDCHDEDGQIMSTLCIKIYAHICIYPGAPKTELNYVERW